MNEKKPKAENSISLTGLFGLLYPILSVLFAFIMVAAVFDTFDLALDVALYTILFTIPVFGLALMITRRLHVSAIITGLVSFLLFYIDQYIFSIRLTHIRISDFRLISQAMRVAGRYHPTWNPMITQRLAIILALSALLILMYRLGKIKYSKKVLFFLGLVIFAASVVTIFSGVIPNQGKEGFDFNSDAERRGLLYSWYCQADGAKMEKPEGYTKEEAQALLAEYDETAGNSDVRVIVIMNESLTDYSLVGKPRFEDPLPYIHSLVESGEAFEGKIAVSVFGGCTANTEFEFLTGHSAAFLPDGCTPYLQYVDHPMNSIVADVGDISKIAIHPYYSEEYNRTQVYRFFGFDRFISGADFGSAVEMNGKRATSKASDNIVSFGEGPLYVRGLISDKSCFERIQEENADFTFSVTMQNHGMYSYKGSDFTNKEYVTEADRQEWDGSRNLVGMLYNPDAASIQDELYSVNQYLTISNLSDQAYGELIEELRKDERKTVVLMFGDHQPGVLLSEHYVDVEDGADPDYTVPYILWANYDVEFDAPEYTSPNYLSAILKKNAGLPLTAWDQFRLDKLEEYPVITANYVLDKDGNAVGKDGLKDYEYLQYMRMFD